MAEQPNGPVLKTVSGGSPFSNSESSTTFTSKLQGAERFPAASVAVAVTRVTPYQKREAQA